MSTGEVKYKIVERGMLILLLKEESHSSTLREALSILGAIDRAIQGCYKFPDRL